MVPPVTTWHGLTASLHLKGTKHVPNQICDWDAKSSLTLWPVDWHLASSVQMSTFIIGLAISVVLPLTCTIFQQLKWAVLFTKKQAIGTFDNDTTSEVANVLNSKVSLKWLRSKGGGLSVWLLIQLLHVLPQLRLQTLSAHCMLDGAHCWTQRWPCEAIPQWQLVPMCQCMSTCPTCPQAKFLLQFLIIIFG